MDHRNEPENNETRSQEPGVEIGSTNTPDFTTYLTQDGRYSPNAGYSTLATADEIASQTHINQGILPPVGPMSLGNFTPTYSNKRKRHRPDGCDDAWKFPVEPDQSRQLVAGTSQFQLDLSSTDSVACGCEEQALGDDKELSDWDNLHWVTSSFASDLPIQTPAHSAEAVHLCYNHVASPLGNYSRTAEVASSSEGLVPWTADEHSHAHQSNRELVESTSAVLERRKTVDIVSNMRRMGDIYRKHVKQQLLTIQQEPSGQTSAR
ncbi:hypothetical protein Purlil1_13098 [Purpureocillium lilacinum]|uniref:Uncharacterized protein n=1 Tax=Purpureocillium lilacinum TaxID=33203 RepID=A0ABR0BF91_PURLI|nr:hypothetical protein Purlil1_13098 [Purpureocillium lilacinum]